MTDVPAETTARTPLPPGSPEAQAQGCHCSFLLNDPTDDGSAFVNPLCPLHGAQHEGRANAS
ncbi:hypothetical protein [Actinomycetospora sp. NBRC 106378]|jgi:hypothetical protein|uniref:hypothetical protein n=1 Tax=Actinomycetospora sp. NBRC 106378 TaxID=3032208 RepID=UPI0024A08BC0|nr:hypothetical protein [Actinomycetospora sp. NBRC 106378]GLZ51579.1 hypothetical protein Acsp07_11960 [Actinomycetospora sp. NBRC 106378]